MRSRKARESRWYGSKNSKYSTCDYSAYFYCYSRFKFVGKVGKNFCLASSVSTLMITSNVISYTKPVIFVNKISNPPPAVKENIKTYWNKRSETFDEDIGHGVDEFEGQLWKKYLAEIIGSAPKEILDVGTGTGVIAIILAELGHMVTGIDLGGKMVEISQKKAAIKHLNVTFLLGDAEQPDFPDSTFDCVICRHLLWTLPHLDTAIREWARVCKAGGLIIAIDGHIKPHEYFQQVDKSSAKNMSKHQELWNHMYSRGVIAQLPVNNDLTIDSLMSLFSFLNLVNVQTQYISEISEYQKKLMEKRKQEGGNYEVNMIWGRVKK